MPEFPPQPEGAPESNSGSSSIGESQNFIPLESIDIFPGYFQFDLEKDEVARAFVAREVVQEEHAVPVRLGAVYALVADARSEAAVSEAYAIKERSREKPFGILMAAEDLINVVDLGRVHPDYRDLFTDEEAFKTLFGNKGFLRFPLRPDYDIPDEMVSLATDAEGNTYRMLQVFTFEGDDPAFGLENELREQLKQKHPKGYGEILCTSYNKSNTGSISDQEKALDLTMDTVPSDRIGVQVNRASDVEGSYSIYSLDIQGLKKERDGTGASDIDKIFSPTPTESTIDLDNKQETEE